jgi:ribosomal protein S18 acetylase RimI-like enzyme
MSRVIIEEVSDLAAGWNELLPLIGAQVEYHAAILGLPVLPDWDERQRQRMSAEGETLVLIARSGAVAVGFLNARLVANPFWFEERYGYIENAFVRSELRAGGIGRALLDEAEAWCREQGLEQLQLTVLAANELGVAVWTRTGFQPQSLRMVKNLKGGSRD